MGSTPEVFRFEPVQLESGVGDDEARLVFLHERLQAVLVCLSPLHEELAGQWFLEAAFNPLLPEPDGPFATIDDFAAWAGRSLEANAPGRRPRG